MTMDNRISERHQSLVDDLVDDGTYERVYNLLEDETFSWMTDAWSKSRQLSAIRFEPCTRRRITRRVEWSDEQYSAIVESCDRLAGQNVRLTIGEKTCVVSMTVQQRLLQLIAR
jgi:hypothetical protein